MSSFDRRDFLKTVSATGVTLGVAGSAFASRGSKMTGGRVVGANDRINIGVIGVGGRGNSHARNFAKFGEQNNACQIVAVCDVYEKRKRLAAEHFKCDGFLDYPEDLARPRVEPGIVPHTHHRP